ncbi:hypothetical protein U1Q18_036603, partial [Sarracenia purpurea var. burkii]
LCCLGFGPAIWTLIVLVQLFEAKLLIVTALNWWLRICWLALLFDLVESVAF